MDWDIGPPLTTISSSWGCVTTGLNRIVKGINVDLQLAVLKFFFFLELNDPNIDSNRTPGSFKILGLSSYWITFWNFTCCLSRVKLLALLSQIASYLKTTRALSKASNRPNRCFFFLSHWLKVAVMVQTHERHFGDSLRPRVKNHLLKAPAPRGMFAACERILTAWNFYTDGVHSMVLQNFGSVWLYFSKPCAKFSCSTKL